MNKDLPIASTVIMCGKSKRKLEELRVDIYAPVQQPPDKDGYLFWQAEVKLSGIINDQYASENATSFDALIYALGSINYELETLKIEHGYNFYIPTIEAGEIRKATIEDIFCDINVFSSD